MPGAPAVPAALSTTSSPAVPRPRRRPGLNRKQVTFLVILAVVWCLIVVAVVIYFAMNMNPSLITLK